MFFLVTSLPWSQRSRRTDFDHFCCFVTEKKLHIAHWGSPSHWRHYKVKKRNSHQEGGVVVVLPPCFFFVAREFSVDCFGFSLSPRSFSLFHHHTHRFSQGHFQLNVIEKPQFAIIFLVPKSFRWTKKKHMKSLDSDCFPFSFHFAAFEKGAK